MSEPPVEDYIADWQAEAVAADLRGDKERARFALEVVVFNRGVLRRLRKRAVPLPPERSESK